MNARATRGPKGGGGRGPKVRGAGRGGKGGGSKKPGCRFLALVVVGSGLMLTSGAAGLALVMVTR